MKIGGFDFLYVEDKIGWTDNSEIVRNTIRSLPSFHFIHGELELFNYFVIC